jgi:hypothetical protein
MFGTIIRFLLGIVAACCVLLLIWVISRYPGKRRKVKKKSSNAANDDFAKVPYMPFGDKPSPQPAEGVAPEIAAVIAAAVTAFCEEDGSCLVVKKIRRLSPDTTPWLAAARGDCMESRKF